MQLAIGPLHGSPPLNDENLALLETLFEQLPELLRHTLDQVRSSMKLSRSRLFCFHPSLVFSLWYTEHKETEIRSGQTHPPLTEPRTPQPSSHQQCPSSRHRNDPERTLRMRSSNHSDDFIWRDLEREIAHHERSLAKKQQPSHQPPAPRPSAHFLSQAPGKLLTWLWPGRTP